MIEPSPPALEALTTGPAGKCPLLCLDNMSRLLPYEAPSCPSSASLLYFHMNCRVWSESCSFWCVGTIHLFLFFLKRWLSQGIQHITIKSVRKAPPKPRILNLYPSDQELLIWILALRICNFLEVKALVCVHMHVCVCTHGCAWKRLFFWSRVHTSH